MSRYFACEHVVAPGGGAPRRHLKGQPTLPRPSALSFENSQRSIVESSFFKWSRKAGLRGPSRRGQAGRERGPCQGPRVLMVLRSLSSSVQTPLRSAWPQQPPKSFPLVPDFRPFPRALRRSCVYGAASLPTGVRVQEPQAVVCPQWVWNFPGSSQIVVVFLTIPCFGAGDKAVRTELCHQTGLTDSPDTCELCGHRQVTSHLRALGFSPGKWGSRPRSP